MTKCCFYTDTLKKYIFFLRNIHCHSPFQNLPSFKHLTVASRICSKLLFSTAEKPPTVFMPSQLQGCVMMSLNTVSGLSHSTATTKASSCHLVPERDDTKHTSYGFHKVSLSIFLFVIDVVSIWVWQFLLPAVGVIYWRQGVNADVRGRGPSSRGARGCSDGVCGEMRKTSISFSFVPPRRRQSKKSGTQSRREKFHFSLCGERWDSVPLGMARRAVSICQCVTLLLSVKCFNNWKL